MSLEKVAETLEWAVQNFSKKFLNGCHFPGERERPATTYEEKRRESHAKALDIFAMRERGVPATTIARLKRISTSQVYERARMGERLKRRSELKP